MRFPPVLTQVCLHTAMQGSLSVCFIIMDVGDEDIVAEAPVLGVSSDHTRLAVDPQLQVLLLSHNDDNKDEEKENNGYAGS